MQEKITIVVPAYKPEFLNEALSSISHQTDQRFNVIIFDDAGPDCIRKICLNYPEFNYIRFNKNLGGSNLIKHWNRCLKLTHSEWVWLFSDDDVMSNNCIAEFYKALEENPNTNLFQFKAIETDESLKTIKEDNSPELLSTKEFIHARFKSRYISCVPDHIFNWHLLQKLNGGFVDFPLAWNSDDATWLLLSRDKPFIKIKTSTVLWRQSKSNISSQQKNSNTKFIADINYLTWLNKNKFSHSYCKSIAWLAARVSEAYKISTHTRIKLISQIPFKFIPAIIGSLVYRHLKKIRNAK